MPRIACCILLALLVVSPRAHAHAIGISQGEYTPQGTTLQVELAFSRSELASVLPDLDEAALRSTFGEGLAVTRGDENCLLERFETRAIENDGVGINAQFRCETTSQDWQVRWPLLEELTLGHRHLANVHSESGTSQAVLHARSDELRIGHAESVGGGFVGMLGFGVEHILTGYDHLLFLLGLVLLGGRTRDLLAMVTAFTVSHSITLAMAALQWLVPSPSLIEPIIALTVAWVGVENFLKVDPTRRWRLTFVFGLIHGFGFAGALGEASIAAEQVPMSLLAFNLGVEAGQLLVLVAVVPALVLLRRLRSAAHGFAAANAFIVLAGLAWFAERTLL